MDALWARSPALFCVHPGALSSARECAVVCAPSALPLQRWLRTCYDQRQAAELPGRAVVRAARGGVFPKGCGENHAPLSRPLTGRWSRPSSMRSTLGAGGGPARALGVALDIQAREVYLAETAQRGARWSPAVISREERCVRSLPRPTEREVASRRRANMSEEVRLRRSPGVPPLPGPEATMERRPVMRHLLLHAQAWWDAQRFDQPEWHIAAWRDQKVRHIQLHVAKALGKVVAAYGAGAAQRPALTRWRESATMCCRMWPSIGVS